MASITAVPSMAILEQLTDIGEINAMLARIDRRSAELDVELTTFLATTSALDTRVVKAEQLSCVSCISLLTSFVLCSPLSLCLFMTSV